MYSDFKKIKSKAESWSQITAHSARICRFFSKHSSVSFKLNVLFRFFQTPRALRAPYRQVVFGCHPTKPSLPEKYNNSATDPAVDGSKTSPPSILRWNLAFRSLLFLASSLSLFCTPSFFLWAGFFLIVPTSAYSNSSKLLYFFRSGKGL